MSKENLAKALQTATNVIEQSMEDGFAGDFHPYVHAATKFERYDGNTDTATCTVTLDIEGVTGFLKKFAK